MTVELRDLGRHYGILADSMEVNFVDYYGVVSKVAVLHCATAAAKAQVVFDSSIGALMVLLMDIVSVFLKIFFSFVDCM